MPGTKRLYSAEEAAYMTRLALSTFRTKVSKLGIKGGRKGQKVFYTRKQVEDVYYGKAMPIRLKKTKKSKSRNCPL